MKSVRSAGIFQANWPLQIHTLNLVRGLASAGIRVHLFLYGANDAMVDMETIESLPSVRVHRIPDGQAGGSPLLSVLRRKRNARRAGSTTGSASPRLQEETSFRTFVPERLKEILGRAILAATWNRKRRDWQNWSRRSLVEPVLASLGGEKLDSVFGVEPYSFVWADAVGQQFEARSIYYSLELKNEKWGGVNARMVPFFRNLRDEALHRSTAVIIQDEDRLGEFRKQTGWNGRRVFYIPVSLFGPATRNSSRFLHRQLGIPEDKNIILSFGWINGHRGSAQLVEAAKSFPEDWVLVFHSGLSWCNDAALMEKATREGKGKVVFSLKRFDSSELESMGASAAAGLCFYSARNEDERMTGQSSEKMSRYAKAGLPVVAWNYPSYQSVFNRHPFGVTVDRYADVPGALGEIFARYENYRSQSFLAYDRIYRAEPHYEPLIEWMTGDQPELSSASQGPESLESINALK